MTLLEAVSACLSKYATFSGRARRSEYWFSNLAVLLALFAWGALTSIIRWDVLYFLAEVFFLACLLPLLAVTVRRLHDVGRSGWWLLIRAIPLVGDVVIFVFCCTDSQPFTNAYGPSPKAVTDAPPGYAPVPPVHQDDSTLPFFQARRQALIERVGRERYDSGEPKLESKKVDDYFDYANGLRPASQPAPRPALSISGLSRRSFALVAGVATVALIILFLVIGVSGAGKTPPQTAVQAGVPAAQPVEPPVAQTIPAQQTPVQVPVPPITPAPPVVQPSPPAPVLQPGDLGLTSPLRPVDCTGKFIVIYHSSLAPDSYAADVQANLANHPGSKYLLTLGSCTSFNRVSASGTMIYAVYGGPFDTLAQACVAASRYSDAYVKVLDNTTPPDQSVRQCS